jgi:hypothetical protein
MDDMLAAARKFNKTSASVDNTEYSDMEAAARAFNKGGKQRYSITSEAGWGALPESKGKESISTVDTQTGKRVKGKKVFNQFIPDTAHVPLSEAPAPKKTTPGWQDALAAVGGGMYGAGLGLAQLGTEGLNKLTMGMNPTLSRAVSKLREEEASRREAMNALASEYQGEGWKNPIRRLGFEGEFLSSAAFPVGRVSQAPSLIGKVARNAAVGGAFGAIQPLEKGESRGKSAAQGAATGAVLTTALAGVGGAAKAVPKVAKAAYRRGSDALDRYFERQVNPEAARLYSGVNGAITKNVRKVAPMSASDIPKTVKARNESIARDVEAIKDVAKLRDEIQLPDATGKAVAGQLPKTHQQLTEALDQGMKRVMDWTTEGLKAAGLEGKRISVQPVVQELKQVTLENGFSQRQVDQAAKMINEFGKLDAGFTPSAAVKRMAGLNNDIKGIFTGKNVSGDSPELLALAANKLRQSLNSTMDSLDAVGPQFSDLRRSWGRMSSMQERTLRSLEQQANREARGGMSVFDILSAEQIIQGLAKGRPEKVAEAAGSFAVGRAWRWLNSTDRAVKNMFKAADYAVGKERLKAPTFDIKPPEPIVTIPRTPIGNYGPAPVSNARERVPVGDYGPAPVSNVRERVPVGDYGPAPVSNVRERVPVNSATSPPAQRIRVPIGNYGPKEVAPTTPVSAPPRSGLNKGFAKVMDQIDPDGILTPEEATAALESVVEKKRKKLYGGK